MLIHQLLPMALHPWITVNLEGLAQATPLYFQRCLKQLEQSQRTWWRILSSNLKTVLRIETDAKMKIVVQMNAIFL